MTAAYPEKSATPLLDISGQKKSQHAICISPAIRFPPPNGHLAQLDLKLHHVTG